MPEFYSPRRDVIEALLHQCRAQSGFYVRRGPINWSTYQFTPELPAAMAVIFGDYDLVPTKRGADQPACHTATITIEMVTRLDERVGRESGFDDSTLDRLAVVAEDILNRLLAHRNEQGDPVVLRIHGFDGGSDPPRVLEMVNADWSVQGIELSFTIDY